MTMLINGCKPVLSVLLTEAQKELAEPSISTETWKALCIGLMDEADEALKEPTDENLFGVQTLARQIHTYAITMAHMELSRRLNAGVSWLRSNSERPRSGTAVPLSVDATGTTYIEGGSKGPIVKASVNVAGYLLDRTRTAQGEVPFSDIDNHWTPPPAPPEPEHPALFSIYV